MAKNKKTTKKRKVIRCQADKIAVLEECGGDAALAAFIAEWMKNGMNATKAYKKLHPEVTERSARVLGARQLTKVNISAILAIYDLGIDKYVEKLRDGLSAKSPVVWDGKVVDYYDDYRVRRQYHKALGELHGLEGRKSDTPSVSVNINNGIQVTFKDYS